MNELDYPCSKCGARRHKPCVRPNGVPYDDWYHAARVDRVLNGPWMRRY